MSLATEHGSAPLQVGVVLFLDTRPALDARVGLVARPDLDALRAFLEAEFAALLP